jgi:hypothetical protein
VNDPAWCANTGVSGEVSGFAAGGRPVCFPPGEIPGLFHTQPSIYQQCLQAEQNQNQCGIAAGRTDEGLGPHRREDHLQPAVRRGIDMATVAVTEKLH